MSMASLCTVDMNEDVNSQVNWHPKSCVDLSKPKHIALYHSKVAVRRTRSLPIHDRSRIVKTRGGLKRRRHESEANCCCWALRFKRRTRLTA